MTMGIGARGQLALRDEYLATFAVQPVVRRATPLLGGLREVWDALRDLLWGRAW